MDEDYFVKIDEPREIRKNILECSRDTINLLKDYENLKQIRVEKVRSMLKIKNIFSEIDLLLKNLKKQLPSFKSAISKSKKQIKKKKPIRKTKKMPEIDVLEQELSKIEQKLSRLS